MYERLGFFVNRGKETLRMPALWLLLVLLFGSLRALRFFRATLTPTVCSAPRMSPASLLLYFAAQSTPSA
ncbi:hypothetical protein DBV14_31870 [Variovorax sp. KBW07]|nr:hypothetical protein DBV14_31870 [Variovorax sp. KBW07]